MLSSYKSLVNKAIKGTNYKYYREVRSQPLNTVMFLYFGYSLQQCFVYFMKQKINSFNDMKLLYH